MVQWYLRIDSKFSKYAHLSLIMDPVSPEFDLSKPYLIWSQ